MEEDWSIYNLYWSVREREKIGRAGEGTMVKGAADPDRVLDRKKVLNSFINSCRERERERGPLSVAAGYIV